MRYLVLCLLVGLLVACRPDPEREADEIEVGDVVYRIDFEAADDFETGEFPESSARLSIENGSYIIEQAGDETAYIWGQGGEALQNVVVEVKTRIDSEYENDLYGVMCRVNEQGEGYAFLISSDGYGTIARASAGRTSVNLSFLTPWREYDKIEASENTIRGVCVDNYLALVVNGDILVDVEDEQISQAGQVGLAAGILIEDRGETGEVLASFDELIVSDSSLHD
jgi:hypothetical protein